MSKNNLLLRKRGGFDELYTPRYAIEPLKKYIEGLNIDWEYLGKDRFIIWCPFDTEESNYVKVLKEWGYKVIHSHIDDGKDFFEYEPEYYDLVISNPPFSIKTEVLKRLYKLGKPFALLLPLTALEGIARNKMYKEHGISLIVLNKRVSFMKGKGSNYFNSSYFCSGNFIDYEVQIAFEELDDNLIKAEKDQLTHQHYKDLRKENK